MPYQRSKAARLREFRQLSVEIRKAEALVKAKIEARNALLLLNERADDPATSREIGAACGDGFGESAVRNALMRLRSRR